MLGSFLPRVLLMVFGYAYQAYECYKTLEHTPEIGRLLFWCRYWIVVAMLTVLERFGDALFSCARTIFIIASENLWYHKQEKGTGKVIAAGHSEGEARDQRPTESVSLSENGIPILLSRKHWLKKLIR
ncbi:unnamed protein product [Prunus armeniaca]|uniref:Uncharacterized protein n=1 Tax=Prunus armeniaca TaxID=36596 RepID=A0A6J5Y4Q8_PRUAR|nr:unnamed protein product [Prunus armeniaca]